MSRTRVKICGITRIGDAIAAIEAGADAIGLVFYAPSPRCVTIEQAKDICSGLPPFVTKVGLFVDATSEEVEEICARVPLDLLQFHGDETESDCTRHERPYMKAIRVRDAEDVVSAERCFPTATGLLVDTYKPGVPGGTGETFDWGLLPERTKLPLILAGGLNPANVRKAIETVAPYAVDVSGGVEASKGLKDLTKINSFMKEVMRG